MVDQLITLGEALAHPETARCDGAIFLPLDAAWDTATACAILAIDHYDESEDEPPFARQNGLTRVLSIDQVQDIVANAREQIAEASPEQLLAAFLHYYERDAFIDFNSGRRS